MESPLERASAVVIGALLVGALAGCTTDAFVAQPPRFPLEPGAVYVSAPDAGTAAAVREALVEAGVQVTDQPKETRLVVVPINGKSQFGPDTRSCGALRNRVWSVYATAPDSTTHQSTTVQEGSFSETRSKTFEMGSRVLVIKAKAYDDSCAAQPLSAHQQMARELVRFVSQPGQAHHVGGP